MTAAQQTILESTEVDRESLLRMERSKIGSVFCSLDSVVSSVFSYVDDEEDNDQPDVFLKSMDEGLKAIAKYYVMAYRAAERYRELM